MYKISRSRDTSSGFQNYQTFLCVVCYVAMSMCCVSMCYVLCVYVFVLCVNVLCIYVYVQGMHYLHSSIVKCHGRLKSSNVYVDQHWTCRVGDVAMPMFRDGERVILFDGDIRESYRKCLQHFDYTAL